MKNFIVGNGVLKGNDLNIGIAPGKFDTKQLILSSLAVLIHFDHNKVVKFVRTMNKDELSKCDLFINDDFTTIFPVIPSYHDIEELWTNNSKRILNKLSRITDETSIEYITKSVKEKISNLESMDCLMDLYSSKDEKDSFGEALSVTLKLIKKEINDSIDEMMYYYTVKNYIENAQYNFISLPIYVQGWRNIVRCLDSHEKIDYAIFSDDDGSFSIEPYNKNIIMKNYVRGTKGICYSGRFFIKVEDKITAEKIIKKLPKQKSFVYDIAKFA